MNYMIISFVFIHKHVLLAPVADIPGLIRGAHLNYGLGFAFLRHVERCVCLLYVLDMSADRPWVQLEDLQYELNQYQVGLFRGEITPLSSSYNISGLVPVCWLLFQCF